MPTETTDRDVHKNNITTRLFIDTADDNYITARWCYAHSLNVDYGWLAVHCLEKYLKAALLMNGHSAIGVPKANGRGIERYGHNIVLLYQRVLPFAADLLPMTLACPAGVDSTMWREETVERYLTRLHRDGQADNRYQLFGYVYHMGDIFKLDAMVFAVRRICVNLDSYVFNRHMREDARRSGRPIDFSERESLLRSRTHWSRTGRLGAAIDGRRDDEVGRALLHENLYFYRQGEEPTQIQFRSSSSNPVLWQDILLPMQQGDDEQKARARELGRWALDNIQLPGDMRRQIEEAI